MSVKRGILIGCAAGVLALAPAVSLAQTAMAPPNGTPLSGGAAWQTLVGNTVTAETHAGSYTEFYTADGTVKHLDKDGKATGKWTLAGDKICFDFPDDDDRVCTRVEVSDGKGAFVDDDGSRDTFTVTAGNSKDL